MNNYIKKTILIFFLILWAFIVLFLFVEQISISRNIKSTSDTSESIRQVRQVYNINFRLSKKNGKKVDIFMPVFDENEEYEAIAIANEIGINKNPIETEEYYSFSNELGNINIFKYINLITYEPNLSHKNNEKIINENEAINIAINFVEDIGLEIDYEEVKVVNYDGMYNVKFVEHINGIPSASFNTNVNVDKYGNVVSVNYFYVNYEKISTVSTKSVEDACLGLPTNYPENFEIGLYYCELVYIYKNSIIQPAYLFKGTTSGGKYFEYYVDASVYE